MTNRSRRGFSLVEILITIVIFSVVIMSLVGLAFQVAHRSSRATDQALAMSVLLAKVDQASAVSYDSLKVIAGCDTTASGPVTIRGCIYVDSLSNVLRQVRVIVQTSVPGARPDTISFQRGRARYPIPLK
ncbi:MAG: type II secretion system protein [Gemmatimonadales bacterium]